MKDEGEAGYRAQSLTKRLYLWTSLSSGKQMVRGGGGQTSSHDHSNTLKQRQHYSDPPGFRDVAICNFNATSANPRKFRAVLQF